MLLRHLPQLVLQDRQCSMTSTTTLEPPQPYRQHLLTFPSWILILRMISLCRAVRLGMLSRSMPMARTPTAPDPPTPSMFSFTPTAPAFLAHKSTARQLSRGYRTAPPSP